jgi:beta-mannosidase
MNMVRVWGGGTFLPPLFYELADTLGVMLSHDFMLTWYPNIPYPAYAAFKARIKAEVVENVGRLARHPSIVVWNGGNEDQCSKCVDHTYTPPQVHL